MYNENVAFNMYDSAVFNVALYEAKHGKIETVEHPEKVWLHEIKQRQQSNIIRLDVERTIRKRRILAKQKALGVFSILMAVVCMAIGYFGIDEMYTVSVPFILCGIGLIKSKKNIII